MILCAAHQKRYDEWKNCGGSQVMGDCVCEKHGRSSFSEIPFSVPCRKCAEEKLVCQKCGKLLGTSGEKP